MQVKAETIIMRIGLWIETIETRQAFTVYRHLIIFLSPSTLQWSCVVSGIQDIHLITFLSQFTGCVQVTLQWWRLWEIHSQ